MSLFGLYKFYKNELPKVAIITIEPWLFNKSFNKETSLWKPLGFYRNYFLKTVMKGKQQNWMEKVQYRFAGISLFEISQLVNPGVTVYNLKELRRRSKVPGAMDYFTITESVPTPDATEDGAIFLKDGSSIEYRKGGHLQDKALIDYVKKYIEDGQMYGLENFHELDARLVEHFEGIIDALQKEGTRIYFYMPPFHPLVYQYLYRKPKYAMVIETERYMTHLAPQKNIKVIGSFNPNDLKMHNNDFVGYMHPTEAALNRLFSSFRVK